jgi:hypothetical protein
LLCCHIKRISNGNSVRDFHNLDRLLLRTSMFTVDMTDCAYFFAAVNFGPAHPAAHGVFRVVLQTFGEVCVSIFATQDCCFVVLRC